MGLLYSINGKVSDSELYLGGGKNSLNSVPHNANIFGLKIAEPDKAFVRSIRLRDPSFKADDAKIPFQYIEQMPQWERSANYDEIGDIIGRFEPLSVYNNSGAQELTLTLNYVAEASEDYRNASGKRKTATYWTLEKIEEITRRLKSLIFPQYDGVYGAPKKCLLNIGKVWPDVPVIIKQVQVEDMGPFTKDFWSIMRKVTIQAKVSYPLDRAISQAEVWYVDTGTTKASNQSLKVFAYKKKIDRRLALQQEL